MVPRSMRHQNRVWHLCVAAFLALAIQLYSCVEFSVRTASQVGNNKILLDKRHNSQVLPPRIGATVYTPRNSNT